MKIFEVVQRNYASLGISLENRWTQKYPWIEQLLPFLLFGVTILSHLMYIFYLANGFMEYVNCVCTTAATTIIFVCLMAVVFQKTTLFECIGNLEKLIDTSELT